MADPYRELLATPGARRVAFAKFVARLPMAMTGIGLLTTLSQLRGSLSVATASSTLPVLLGTGDVVLLVALSCSRYLGASPRQTTNVRGPIGARASIDNADA